MTIQANLSRCNGVRRYPAHPEIYYCPLRMSCWRFIAPRDLMFDSMVHPAFQYGPPATCADYWWMEPIEIVE